MANPSYMRSQTISRTAEVDAGLRAYMNKVYALMTGAMVLTGLVSYVVGTNEALLSLFRNPETLQPNLLGWAAMLAPLAFVFLFAGMIHRMSVATAQMTFWAFGAVVGLSIAWIFQAFTGLSIARVFFITAASFGALSLYGYTTKKDISGWGSFLIMGVIGLIIAMVVNIFLASAALHWAISVLGVLIFAGLTAYDTQQIKNEYLQFRSSPEGEAYLEKGAVMGALRLYLDFLNMFMFLLQLLGSRE